MGDGLQGIDSKALSDFFQETKVIIEILILFDMISVK